jgi:queuine tRNA-ribosyltransferase
VNPNAVVTNAVGCEVVITRSGAPAMLDRAFGELMHPIVGPLVEAEHIYIAPSRLEERLAQAGDGAFVLLDVGLGAGSNAIAAWKVSERMPATARRLEIVSFERSLEAMQLASSDAHAPSFGFEGSAGDAARALLATSRHETPRTTWRLVQGELPATLAREEEASADMVYWDAYSPRANPELWTMAAFVALRRVCRDSALVYTFSGATATRSALLLAGFAVAIGDAKREERQTTMAAPHAHDLAQPLDRRWLERLGRSSAPFPSDAPSDALARVAALPQFAER